MLKKSLRSVQYLIFNKPSIKIDSFLDISSDHKDFSKQVLPSKLPYSFLKSLMRRKAGR